MDLARYGKVFKDLTDHVNFSAGDGFTVVEVSITNDSSSVIAICKNESLDDDEDEFIIRSFSLKTFDDEWNLSLKGTFVKVSEI